MYRTDIDGLRAIAVLSVVAFHTFPEYAPGGFVGVDIFFVISGYLISKIILQSLYDSTFSLYIFYVRRIKRIFPALIVVMATCIILGWFVLLPGEYQKLGKHIAGGAGFVSNFILWAEAGYFDDSADTKPLLHLWSLGIEEQFYLVIPLVFWIASKRHSNPLTVILILTISSFLLNWLLIRNDPIATFYMPFTRFWELLCGSLLAYTSLQHSGLNSLTILTSTRIRFPYIQDVLAFVGLALCGIAFWNINKDSAFPGLLAVLPVLGAMMIIFAGQQAWLNQNILSRKPFVWFGLISFPLYLWHWPLLSFLRISENGPVSYWLRIAAIILSVFLSWITYRLIERPIRFGARSTDKSKAIMLFSTMCVVGFSGIVVYQKNGMEHRLEGDNKYLNEIISTPYPHVEYSSCDQFAPELHNIGYDDCRISKPKFPDIMFIGDSHTKQFQSTNWNKFGDYSVMMVTKSECLPFANATLLNKGSCKKAFNQLIDYVSKNNSVKTIVLSSYWAYLLSGNFSSKGDNWRIPEKPQIDDILTFKESARLLIQNSIHSNKLVVFVQDIPDLDFNINTCFDNRPLRITVANIRDDCSMDADKFFQRLGPIDDILNEILAEFPQVKVFNPRGIFCNESKCRGSDGRLPYYYNGDHLNHYGAGLVIDSLMKYIADDL